MDSALKRNKEYSDRHIQNIGSWEIPSMVRHLVFSSKNILDLGCGDGGTVSGIIRKYPSKKVTGVDISPRRIDSLKERFPKKRFICGDVCSTKLKDNSFDLIISTQVIEHVEDDKKMVREMHRLLKKGGFLYISSVIKKPWAIYKYRNKGKFVLDPTHEREYSSKEEFLNLFLKKFRLLKVIISQVRRKKIISFNVPGYYIIDSLWKK